MASPNPPSTAVVGIGNLRDFPKECAILLSCLYESTSDLHAVNAFGWNALHIAILRGAPLTVISALVVMNIDGSAIDVHGRNALHLAARMTGSVDAAAILCTDARARQMDNDGNTPLHLAVTNDNPTTVQVLIPHSNINQRTAEGLTAIHLAASFGYAEIVNLLLNDGADIEISCRRGWTPAMAACCVNSVHSLHLLLDADAEPDRINTAGRSALMIAASLGHVEIVKILLDVGVDINYTTMSGLTAYESCIQHQPTRELLLRYDVQTEVDGSWTPERFYSAPECDRLGIYTTILCFTRLNNIAGTLNMQSLIHPCSRALRMTPRGWFRWDGDTDAGRYRRRLAALMRITTSLARQRS